MFVVTQSGVLKGDKIARLNRDKMGRPDYPHSRAKLSERDGNVSFTLKNSIE